MRVYRTVVISFRVVSMKRSIFYVKYILNLLFLKIFFILKKIFRSRLRLYVYADIAAVLN